MLWQSLELYVRTTEGQLNGDFRWSYDVDTRTLTVTGQGALPDYEDVPTEDIPWVPWLEKTDHVVYGEGITSTGCCLMQYLSMKDVTLPSTIRKLDKRSFFGCNNLSQIDLPEGLEEIGANAFNYCEELKTITIPAGVTKIGDEVFRNCSGLTEIWIPASVTSFGSNIFLRGGMVKLLTIYTDAGSTAAATFRGEEDIRVIEDISNLPVGGITDKTYTTEPITQSISLAAGDKLWSKVWTIP